MESPKQSTAGKVPPVLPSATLAKPPLANTSGRRAPRSKSNWWLIPCLLMGILFLGIVISVAGHRGLGSAINLSGKPEVQALEKLCALNLSSQASQAQALCTARGLVMAQNLVDQQGKFPLATFRITSAKENPNLTDIQMVRETADGTTVVFARMLYENGWKFDDIYIQQANDQVKKIWLSDAIEHPILTTLGQVDWKQAAENANTFLDLCQKFKQTFGDDKSRDSE